MRYYRSYMDRQEISAGTHEKLLELNVERKAPRRLSARYGALAACAALALGIGVWKLSPAPANEPPSAHHISSSAPEQSAAAEPPQASEAPDEESHGFVVHSPMKDNLEEVTYVPSVDFQDVSIVPELSACRAYMPGSFLAELTLEDIQKIFWGPEGIPETDQTEIGRQDLPWALFWDGYTVGGTAWYDGEGRLMDLNVYGQKGRASFNLELNWGSLPLTCVVEPGRPASDVFGVSVTAWSSAYDWDGDGLTDYICGSEFLTEGGVGVRFVSRNNGVAEKGLDGESWFNTLFIRQALPDGLHMDHLLTNDNIPAWRDVRFDTLDQARQEAEFAPYLPTAEPEGYSAYVGNKDFHGRLSYQEGKENRLFVRWSRGYDDVEVCVYREGGTYRLADAENPASYDVRLYEIPWYDTVPEPYRATVSYPAFRAEDMSLAIVEARGQERDNGGLSFQFKVLHPDGTVVSYHCTGVTARQVWEMVEETLP